MAKARFEWDTNKDEENQKKHGVSFAKAQFAFADPDRVIAEDLPQLGRTAILLLRLGRWRGDNGALHLS